MRAQQNLPDKVLPSRTLAESLRIMANSLKSAGHHSCRAAMFDAAAELERLEGRIEDLESVVERVANLAGYKWPTDRLTYPDSEIGKYAATAVRLCEDELREAIHG